MDEIATSTRVKAAIGNMFKGAFDQLTGVLPLAAGIGVGVAVSPAWVTSLLTATIAIGGPILSMATLGVGTGILAAIGAFLAIPAITGGSLAAKDANPDGIGFSAGLVAKMAGGLAMLRYISEAGTLSTLGSMLWFDAAATLLPVIGVGIAATAAAGAIFGLLDGLINNTELSKQIVDGEKSDAKRKEAHDRYEELKTAALAKKAGLSAEMGISVPNIGSGRGAQLGLT